MNTNLKTKHLFDCENHLDEFKEVDNLSNKYGVEFTVGDYVFLPLPFYNDAVWKIVKIYDGCPRRLCVDQGADENEGGRHIRGFSIDNPFIKLDKKTGEVLFSNKNFINYIVNSFKYGEREKDRTLSESHF